MILCIKTNDLRTKVIYEYLSSTNNIIFDNIVEKCDDIDTVILPVQGITHDGYIHGTNIIFKDFVSKATPKRVFTGLINNNMIEICNTYNTEVLSYLDENVSYRNTLLTSEGLLKVLYDRGYTLSNKKILITGYGRLATNLSNIFLALNSKVTIYARKEKDRVSAKLSNLNTIDSLEGNELSNFDIVINTIPHNIFTNNNKNYFGEKTIFIDISSLPGGFDNSYKDVIVELGIPGRLYPYDSGIEIAKYIGDKV